MPSGASSPRAGQPSSAAFGELTCRACAVQHSECSQGGTECFILFYFRPLTRKWPTMASSHRVGQQQQFPSGVGDDYGSGRTCGRLVGCTPVRSAASSHGKHPRRWFRGDLPLTLALNKTKTEIFPTVVLNP